MAVSPTPQDRLNQGTAPEIVAAMYGLDVKELKQKAREMHEEGTDRGGMTAKSNAEAQPRKEKSAGADTDKFGVASVSKPAKKAKKTSKKES